MKCKKCGRSPAHLYNCWECDPEAMMDNPKWEGVYCVECADRIHKNGYGIERVKKCIKVERKCTSKAEREGIYPFD